MSLGFSYILAWHNSFQIWKDNRDKRTQGSRTIVITVYNHYINIAVLPNIPYIPMGSKASSLLDPPSPVSLSKRRRV